MRIVSCHRSWLWLLLMVGAGPMVGWAVPPEAGPPADVLKRLAAEDFKERQGGQDALLAWGRRRPKEGMEWLYRHATTETDPEIRRRCLGALREMVMDTYRREGEGYIGIMMQAVAAVVPGDAGNRFGVRITFVVPGGPAAKAGLPVGGLIVGAGDRIWRDADAVQDLQKWIRARKPGSKITLKVLRGNAVADVEVTLDRRPPEVERLLPFGDMPDAGRLQREAEEAYFQDWLEKRKARK
ncbi:PDZ domain-containing protein [Luteolibacter ambystomatis]|uniref:PDZ domain-containing protein n=1 Tax=Luteolibacter ambystomatis TaxID=2824561 RepID=A0A975IYS2_9BACT|nr:PDZ domain-containing protein [Luteolibacter ambystomatis]QUE50173.1 PDZ domain-containing protein [Luteolibacter ambystomatis]